MLVLRIDPIVPDLVTQSSSFSALGDEVSVFTQRYDFIFMPEFVNARGRMKSVTPLRVSRQVQR